MVGISFKIAKSGTRYVPKLSSNVKVQKQAVGADENGGHVPGTKRSAGFPTPKRALSEGFESPPTKRSRGEVSLRSTLGDFRTKYVDPLRRNVPKDAKASFAINLFPDGFSIDKPTEKGKRTPAAFEVSELHLLPYDRNTGDFLRAIDGGWIPSTLLEDIPCKYIDGCVVCELRDYRNSLQGQFGEPLHGISRIGRDGDWMPIVQRVVLQRNSGNIFKDLKSMDFDGWTYRECLELEARLINTVQSPLCLDPTPDVAKEAYITNYNKLKYNILYGRYRKTSGSLRERRLRIAATAKALSRADALAKRRRSSLDGGLAGGPALVNDLVPSGHHSAVLSPGGRHKSLETSRLSPAVPAVYVQQPSASQNSLGQPSSLARAGGLAHSLSVLSVPSGPMSPSLSTPATPATSTGGYEVTSGLGGSSMPGRRESKESAAAVRAEAKQMKAKQAVQEKAQLQQRKLQEKQDAKEMKEKQRKEKLQQQHQQKIEKQQQLSRSSSHLSLLSQHSGSISMGDGSTTPRSENRSSMGDQREGADMVIKMEPQEVARPKQEFDSQTFEDVEKGRQELQVADARKHGQPLHMGMVQQPLPMNPLLPPTALPTSGVSFGSGIGVQDLRMGPNHSLGPPVGTMAQAQAHALASNLVPAGGPNQMDQMQHTLAQSRQRQNSLPKPTTSAMQSPGVSGSFLLPGSGAFPVPGVKVEPATSGPRVLASGVSEDQDQNKEMESMHKLVAAIQRHGLHSRKKPVDNVILPNKSSSSFHLLSVALSEANDEVKEPMGQRSMANSLVGGNINSRKTRSLLFVKTEPKPEQAFQGGMNFQPAYHRSRKRLVLCGRAKDSLVEAIIQVGDDQEEEAVPPHHVLPTMSNVHVADRFAKQYCALLKKENYELVSDEVQQSAPRNPVVNAASSARALPAGASTLGNPQAGHLATTQRAGMNPQGAIPGNVISTHNQMQPSSPSQLAANRMPPPSNAPSRQQMLNSHLGQQAVASGAKSSQMDSAQASQLAAQQQHHQLQQQVQMQRQPQQQQQQQQQQQHQHQMATASQLAQLTGQGQNSVAQSNQLLQLQYIHQQQQQRQHQHLLNQRKLMLPGAMGNTLPGMNNMNGVGMPANAGGQASLANMVNLGGMNNVGMGGMSGMASMSGMSSLGGMSPLGNMGQLGAMNALGQQANLLRPGNMNQAAAMQASKVQQLAAAGRGGRGTGVLPNTGGVVRNQVDALSALGGANQVHGGAGVSVMGQGMNRSNNLGPLQRAQVTGLASPKVPSANQNYYLNSQLGAQQLKSQNAQQQQQQQQQQQLLNSQQQHQQQQQLLNSQQLNSQQLNPQQLNTQQLNPQQLNTQQLNPQQLNTQQLNPQQLNTQQLNPQQLSSQQLNPQQLSSQQLNPQQLSTQQLNPQQLSTQQLNPQQLSTQQLNPQQLNTQQLNPQQLSTQQVNPQQQLNPQQQISTQQLNPQQLNSQQLNPQLSTQQISSQQLNPQQQLSGGGSLNSLVGNPASPQLSSGQSLSAVGNMSVSSSSVELQNASRAAAAAAAAGRAPVIPSRRPTMPQPGQQPQSGQPTQSQ